MAASTFDWLTGLREFLRDKVDPRTKDLPLMDNPIPIITASICYLYFVCYGGPQYMRDKKPYNLQKVITAYNIFQIISCTVIIYGMLMAYPITKFGCEAINYSDPAGSYRIAWWTWLVTILKLAEFLETVFFVLRKKTDQISGLHLYHHVSTFWIGWITTKFSPGEFTALPVIINCFIHILMYSYYLVALHGGKELQKKIIIWKKSLTIMQMAQFTIIIGYIGSSLRSHCTTSRPLLLLWLANIITNYVLFYKFYKSAYKKKV
ncbi:hypothetical protein RUM44_011128 [Polyplax serrata]|uniref:Elongation of very long chain fatty acids protein n=1 Tax=Polyplax serrata TaxID=468196 RepID=A0ABR1APG5_POLSC